MNAKNFLSFPTWAYAIVAFVLILAAIILVIFVIRQLRGRRRLGVDKQSSKDGNTIQMSFLNDIYSNCENTDHQRKSVEPEVSNGTEC